MVKYLLCVCSMIIQCECSPGVCLTVFFIGSEVCDGGLYLTNWTSQDVWH